VQKQLFNLTITDLLVYKVAVILMWDVERVPLPSIIKNCLLVQLRNSGTVGHHNATVAIKPEKEKFLSKSSNHDRQYQVNQALLRLKDILLKSIINVSKNINIIDAKFQFIK
jgi:hypothetical protein